MKPTKGGADDLETFAMENCLMLLATKAAAAAALKTDESRAADDVRCTYTCKTCGKKFNSFQALGGHRASHQKLNSTAAAGGGESPATVKPKRHACSVCGVEFLIGQALGGHMRRHRPVVAAMTGDQSTVTTDISVENSDGNDNIRKRKNDDVLEGEVGPVIKKSNSKRVCLDLNLSFARWIEKEEEQRDDEIEEGEIVEHEADEEENDFLKLELRQPIRV